MLDALFYIMSSFETENFSSICRTPNKMDHDPRLAWIRHLGWWCVKNILNLCSPLSHVCLFSPIFLFPKSKPERSLTETFGMEEPKESLFVKVQGNGILC